MWGVDFWIILLKGGEEIGPKSILLKTLKFYISRMVVQNKKLYGEKMFLLLFQFDFNFKNHFFTYKNCCFFTSFL